MKVGDENEVIRLCSVTILFHPDDTVFEYIASYVDKVQRAIIIDNSEHASLIGQELTRRFGADKIYYIQNRENVGVAGALNMAFAVARAEGFTWMLTMDQDSGFENHDFFDISKPLMQQNNVAVVAASYSTKLPFSTYHSPGFHRLLFVVTSGNLVNIEGWYEAGMFEEKLFIDEVDNDFCLRLNKKKFLVLSSNEIFLKHSLGVSFSIRLPFSSRHLPIGIHSPQRMYFTVRNGLYVMKQYAFSHPQFFFNRLKHLSIKLFLIVFYYPEKRRYGSYFFKGIKDFLLSRFSTPDNPGS